MVDLLRRHRELIVMDAAQTLEVCRLAPATAIVIAAHMEALDHATVTRADLRSAAAAAGISTAQLCIPDDGESVKLSLILYSVALCGEHFIASRLAISLAKRSGQSESQR
ncbi:MAG: hypothetical protein U0528_03230 [Anaerolineae bacterium]